MPHRSSTGSFIKWCPRNASLNVHSEEVTPGCWPSRQIGKEKAISETGQEEKKIKMGKRTQTLDRGRLEKSVMDR